MTRFKHLFTPKNGFALALLLVTLLAFVSLSSEREDNVFSAAGFKTLVNSLGPWGPLAYILIIAVAVIVSQIPGVPLAIAAGALWGPFTAGIYSVAGGFLGGVTAYFLGRTLGRSAMKALAGKVMVFNKEKGEVYLGGLIFVTRLVPLFPFDIVSYAAGLSGLSFGIFALATLLGMIPSTFLLTYLGSAFTDSVELGLGVSVAAVLVLLGLPVLIQRYNLFGLRGSIGLE